MSEMFSRRVFMRGLGVVAAAAALTACSSTNEAVNQALIEVQSAASWLRIAKLAEADIGPQMPLFPSTRSLSESS